MSSQPPAPPADDEDTPYDFPQRLVVSAAGLQPPATKAIRSVFDMAGAALAAQRLRTHGRFGDEAGFLPSPAVVVVVRTVGVTRCTGSSYPANRWTDERHELERQRRARQKPPKPTKKAKTRSKKLLELIGSDS